MEPKVKHLLDLDDYCLLEIMKCIIADCELREEPPDHPTRYQDIENFAKAYEYIDNLLKTGFKSIYYRRELSLVSKLRCLTIDFGQLIAIIAKKKEGDAYWKLYIKAIRENNALESFQLKYNVHAHSEFIKHYQMLTSALANKEQLRIVKLALNGYHLEDLPNFGHLTELYLDGSMSSEALANVCKSNPELCKLEFMTSQIQGRLYDIVPHCRNLQYLKFVPKRDADAAEYAPLVELPRLKEVTIHGAYSNGSLLRMFKAIEQCHASETLSVNFSDMVWASSRVTFARMHSLKRLRITSRKIPPGIELIANYNFLDISRDTSPLEDSLAAVTLMEASFIMDWQGRLVTLLQCPSSDIDIREFGLLLNACDVNSLHIVNEVPAKTHNPDGQTPKAKLFASMVTDGLKSIQIAQGHLDRTDTLELVKIESVRLLNCTFSDWESTEPLGELRNLTNLVISVKREFEVTHSKALCRLLSTCQVSGVIDCLSWRIEFVKNKRIAGEVTGVRTLRILYACRGESLNKLFEALSDSDLIPIEEVRLEKVNFRDVNQVTRVQSIKKLSISVADASGIEQLSELTQLEELTLTNTARGTLVKLLDQLAAMESPSLQQLKLKSLSPEELSKVSRIKSLRKLELFSPFFSTDYDALKELANSNIEELVFVRPQISLQKLFAACAARTTSRLRHLKIVKGSPDLEAFEELSKLKGLTSFYTSILDSGNLPFLRKLETLESLTVQVLAVDSKFHWGTLKKLVIHLPMDLDRFQCLAELENLESLTFSLLSSDWNPNNDPSDVLANLKNLKELHIETTGGSQHRVYQALAHRKGLQLRHLSAPIGFAEELIHIMGIKSLKTLHLQLNSYFAIDSDLDQLEKLEALHIKRAYNVDVLGDQFDTVLAILKSCRNLDSFAIKYTFLWHAKFIGDVHRLLRSIRDPYRQFPLNLTIEEIHNTQFDRIVHINFVDDEYLQVFYNNM